MDSIENQPLRSTISGGSIKGRPRRAPPLLERHFQILKAEIWEMETCRGARFSPPNEWRKY